MCRMAHSTFYVGRNAILPLFTQLTIAGLWSAVRCWSNPSSNTRASAPDAGKINQRDYPVPRHSSHHHLGMAALFVADLLYSLLDHVFAHRRLGDTQQHLPQQLPSERSTHHRRGNAHKRNKRHIRIVVFVAILILSFIGHYSAG